MNKKLEMLLNTLNRVKDVSLKFKNPNFNSYFFQKAEDTIKMVNDKRDSLTHEEVDKLMEEYSDLEQVLNRQQVVQNMYYTDEPKVDK